jgi:hypothetical protein
MGLPLPVQCTPERPMRGHCRVRNPPRSPWESTPRGVRFVRVYSWPASIPEGNRTRLTIIDDRASADPGRGAITRWREAGRPLFRDFCFGVPQCSGAYVRAAESLLASEASLQTVQLVLTEQPAIDGQLGQEAIADRPVIMANGAFPTEPGKRRPVTEASV